jgi:hypothetical protein
MTENGLFRKPYLYQIYMLETNRIFMSLLKYDELKYVLSMGVISHWCMHGMVYIYFRYQKLYLEMELFDHTKYPWTRRTDVFIVN